MLCTLPYGDKSFKISNFKSIRYRYSTYRSDAIPVLAQSACTYMRMRLVCIWMYENICLYNALHIICNLILSSLSICTIVVHLHELKLLMFDSFHAANVSTQLNPSGVAGLLLLLAPPSPPPATNDETTSLTIGGVAGIVVACVVVVLLVSAVVIVLFVMRWKKKGKKALQL